MHPQALMIQGTTSDAGKSTLVTAFCRYFQRQNYTVAPFKPQNMALNSAVTVAGGEIGRAQAVQAVACGISAHTDMNPILLKPQSDKTVQVIVQGKVLNHQDAHTYHAFKPTAMQYVLDSYNRLQQQYQIVITEGAGSPAEINLRAGDIANMGFAEKVNCPVILIADIDKGGVFAHIVGTLELLSATEQQRIIGFVINRFRGDKTILESGLQWLEQRTGKPVLAVLPYLPKLYLDAEDSLAVTKAPQKYAPKLNIVVIALPKMSNITDFDPLVLHPEIKLKFTQIPEQIKHADLIILPGSKSVRADFIWLQDQGWQIKLNQHLRYGGKVLGICGGFQMLGQAIHDPEGFEGSKGSSPTLGFLELETTLTNQKKLCQVAGKINLDQQVISGYEIHTGVSTGLALQRPLITLDNQVNDGAISADNLIIGTYIHGLFDLASACNSLLQWAGLKTQNAVNHNDVREAGINLITDTLEQHFDFIALEQALIKFQQLDAKI